MKLEILLFPKPDKYIKRIEKYHLRAWNWPGARASYFQQGFGVAKNLYSPQSYTMAFFFINNLRATSDETPRETQWIKTKQDHPLLMYKFGKSSNIVQTTEIAK